LKALARVIGGYCAATQPTEIAWDFVTGTQATFADHGFCARAPDRSEFDRECFYGPNRRKLRPEIWFTRPASRFGSAGRSAAIFAPYLPPLRLERIERE